MTDPGETVMKSVRLSVSSLGTSSTPFSICTFDQFTNSESLSFQTDSIVDENSKHAIHANEKTVSKGASKRMSLDEFFKRYDESCEGDDDSKSPSEKKHKSSDS